MRWVVAIAVCSGLGGCHWLFPYSPAAGDRGHDRASVDRDQRSVVDRVVADWRGDRAMVDVAPMADHRRDSDSGGCKDLGLQELSTVPEPALAAAMAAFNSGCSPSTICEVTAARSRQLPTCFASSPTVQTVLPHVIEQGDEDAVWWSLLTSTGVPGTFFFGTAYSSKGPALLQAVNTFGGATTPPGMYVEVEVQCQGCHKFVMALVLYYPGSRTVVRLDGVRGYD